MADETQTLRGINWRDVFPFTNLFRAFRVAIHPSKLLLGLILLLLLYTGGRLMDGIWASKHKATSEERAALLLSSGAARPSEMAAFRRMGAADFNDIHDNAALAEVSQFASRYGFDPAGDGKPRGVFITYFNYEVEQVNNVAQAVLDNNWLGFGRPSVLQSVKNFVFTGPSWLFYNHPLFATLITLWFLVLWSVFGGAIARIAAVHVARDEKISVRQALRFSTSKVLSFLFAPLIPLIIILALAALLGAGGLLLYVPWIGPIALGALFFLVLGIAFVMTLVLIGTIGGFNLMYPTVAVEGSDSFDAISRSFSYVFARPWRTLFYTAVALAYGALTYLFVRYFLIIMLTLAHGSIGWFLGDKHQPYAFWNGVTVVNGDKSYNTGTEKGVIWQAPELAGGTLTYDVPFGKLKASEDVGAGLIAFWVYLTISLLGAYAISFYFSANTIIYYLLRREVDATDLDDVYMEQADEDFTEPTADVPVTTPSAAATAGTLATTATSTDTTATSPGNGPKVDPLASPADADAAAPVTPPGEPTGDAPPPTNP